MRWVRKLASAAVAAALLATPVWAQSEGVIREGHTVFRPAPEALRAPEALTADAISAARGNLARWRDEERAQNGPFLLENEIANTRARDAHTAARLVELRKPARRRANVPAPVELPVGQLLPSIQGYFAYFYEEGGSPKRTIVSGAWWDPRSNAGEESLLRIQSVLADAFCGQREVPLTDVAYLGREYTRDMEALNTAWLGPLSAPPILSGHDVKFTRTPAGATFMRYYPVRALARNLEGASTLLCDVTVALALSCTLVRAKPEGFGFGEAAVQIAHTAFTVDPVLRDGSPAAGRKMCLNIGFALMD